MKGKKLCEKTDKKFCHRRKGQEVFKILWEEGDPGTRFKWNKVGEVKCYYFICEDCGNKQEFLPL